MPFDAYHGYRQVMSFSMSGALKAFALINRNTNNLSAPGNPVRSRRKPRHPESFQPLSDACFQNPYAFYQVLRDDYPLYRLANGVICVSRYQDIVTISKDTETFSSAHQGLVANLQPGQDLLKEVARFETLSRWGVIPADVLATSDPPHHTTERKIGHSCLNARYVKQLEDEVRELCQTLLTPHIRNGQLEFMKAIGWRLPMILIIRLLGLPEKDFEKIKRWCVAILESQNGTQNGGALAESHAAALSFLRYCWRHYLAAKSQPNENLMGVFARSANNPCTDFDDQRAVSAIFQLLIAGSDSSATTMGNAIKLLVENPDIQTALRDDHSKIPAFIEEVFRLESAFQGHFRWVKRPTKYHGIHLPRGSRIFLIWASGNRDERFFDQPDQLILNRKNGKKHLTFGHGVHACLGRELARLEIRVLLQELLKQTDQISIAGDTPYIASMFARTLVKLPLRFNAGISRDA